MNTDTRTLLVVCLVAALVAQVAACSDSSKGESSNRDAAIRVDTVPASSDVSPPRDRAASDTTTDAPGNVTASDAAGAILDAPLVQDGARDTRALYDSAGGSADLLARDLAASDVKSLQDTKTTGPDISQNQNDGAADARLPNRDADDMGEDAGMAPVSNPGTPVYVTSRAGKGPCAGKTVGSLIDEIYAADPSLPGLFIYPGSGSTDWGVIYAFARSDDGFSFVFKYGSGDCPSGCFEHDYWYFQTDGNCLPHQVGHYLEKSRSCGTPLWGVPANPRPPVSETCP